MFAKQDNGKANHRGSPLFIVLLSKDGGKPNALFAKQDNGKVNRRGVAVICFVIIQGRRQA